MKAAASFNSFSRRPVITTCAPSSTKRLAVARPIPLLPPVMTATLPSSVFMIFFPFTHHIRYYKRIHFWQKKLTGLAPDFGHHVRQCRPPQIPIDSFLSANQHV